MKTYMSKQTGECWETKDAAKTAYRAGHDIAVLDWSETLDQWVVRCEWEH